MNNIKELLDKERNAPVRFKYFVNQIQNLTKIITGTSYILTDDFKVLRFSSNKAFKITTITNDTDDKNYYLGFANSKTPFDTLKDIYDELIRIDLFKTLDTLDKEDFADEDYRYYTELNDYLNEKLNEKEKIDYGPFNFANLINVERPIIVRDYLDREHNASIRFKDFIEQISHLIINENKISKVSIITKELKEIELVSYRMEKGIIIKDNTNYKSYLLNCDSEWERKKTLMEMYDDLIGSKTIMVLQALRKEEFSNEEYSKYIEFEDHLTWMLKLENRLIK